MAVKGLFNPFAGLVSVFGDNLDNTITFSRNAAGTLLVNGGAVPIIGGTATVANTNRIQVFGQGGNDVITLDEANGALPGADVFGGAGNDTITGGSGADLLFGQQGDDTLLGKGGNDLLFGGDGNDTLIGGTGDDQMFGQSGDDRMIWNPGEGTDLMEGGAGIDTAEVNGGNGAEAFSITANGTRVRFDRLSPAPFSLDIGTTENLVVNANGGDDTITAGNGLAALIKLTIDGGAGNDTITGGDGADTLLGGDGNDLIVGGRGNDLAFLGAGDDVFVWNPGDGSDTVEGQNGNDTLLFNGANISEKIDISANGSRIRFTRDVANITMDVNGVEQLQFNALGGADTIAVHDLSGTDVKQVNIDLSSPAGSGTGDGSADTVVVDGSNYDNQITVVGSGTSVSVLGLSEQVNINGTEGANDRLVINALGGNDVINATALPAGVIGLTIDAGAGDDTIFGSAGADILLGGDGNDFVVGGRGDDVAMLGAGDDQFLWNPGDGSDVVEGQDGNDTLLFNGANVSENIDISANGGRVRFFRDVANITMDLNDVETVQVNALGGADTIVVNDLSGTDVQLVALNLAGSAPGGDGQADTVVVNATNGDDVVSIASNGGVLTVNGLAATVTVANLDASLDTLVVNGLAGNDKIDASTLTAGQVNLTINAGDGNDLVLGSQGNDLINGGRGDDAALMGDGDDTFVWNPGDGNDIVEGQGGFDTLQFNGANIAEKIDISANGGRVRFTRDVANITMDLNDTEAVNFRALGGADTITVNDLSGTDVTQVNIDLAGSDGVSDGQADTIVINATNGDDVIIISGGPDGVVISGLSETVTIAHLDANDRIVINGLGGDDVIEASGLAAGVQLTASGGDGDDVLIGGAGNDVLNGNAGDDVLIGGPGQDVLDGGTGDNIVIQSIIAGGLGGIAAPQSANAEFDGTAGDDVLTVASKGGAFTASGFALPATLPTGQVAFAGLDGNDTIDLSGLASSSTMEFILDGDNGDDFLHGGQGNDLLVGGGGADRFAFSGMNGVDTIADFVHGLDKIEISGYGAALAGFGDLSGHMAQVGNDVQIDLGAKVAGAGMIVLNNTQLATIGASDFTFA